MRIVGVSGAPISSATRGAAHARGARAGRARDRIPRADRDRAPRRRASAPHASTRHPAAAFLAQLIATQMQAPQTRARRRAEPEEAIAVYRSMTKPGALLSASLSAMGRASGRAGHLSGSALIPERAAVLARLGAADQHAALPVDDDRLPAAPRRGTQRDVVAARLQSRDRRGRHAALDLASISPSKNTRGASIAACTSMP